MAKIILIIFAAFQFWQCGTFSAALLPPSAADQSVNVATPAPTPTVAPLSECSKTRVENLREGVNVPQELCFDATKPVDAKERSDAKVGNSTQSATIEETDLPFDKLPAEVRKIVEITVPDFDPNAAVFSLTIIPTADERRKIVWLKVTVMPRRAKTERRAEMPMSIAGCSNGRIIF